MTIRQISTNLLLAFGGTVFGFVFLEVVLQLTTPSNPPVSMPLYRLVRTGQTYELLPNISGYAGRISTNALGLRSPEQELSADTTIERVLVLGDSVSFSGDDRYEDTYPAKLERLLRANKINAAVINSGVPGYSPYNQLSWFKSVGKQLRPDVVIIQVCLNDIVDPYMHWQAVFGPGLTEGDIPAAAVPDPSRRAWQKLRVLMRKSIVLREIEDGLRYSVPPKRYVSLEDDLSIREYGNPESPSVRWLDRTMQDLVNEVRKVTNKVVLLVPPLATQLSAGYADWQPQAYYADFAKRNKLPLIDLAPAFQPLGADETFRLFKGRGYYDIWHLTPKGHSIAASKLAQVLKARKW